MKKLEVFICDLTHDGARIANEHIPLGASFVHDVPRWLETGASLLISFASQKPVTNMPTTFRGWVQTYWGA